jgi:hypothetical protein
MRKLRLDLDHLEVESFEATPRDGEERGTVQGHAEPYTPTCPSSSPTWGDNYTCDEATCHYSCYEQTCRLLDSCDGHCW